MTIGDLLIKQGFQFEQDSFVKKIGSYTNVRIDTKGFITFKQYNVAYDRYHVVCLPKPVLGFHDLYCLLMIINSFDSKQEFETEEE